MFTSTRTMLCLSLLRIISRPASYNRNFLPRMIAVNRIERYFATTRNEICTIGEMVKHWSHHFESEGISEPVESIEHILAHVLGTKQIMDLAGSSEKLTLTQIERLEKLCECRLSRMPVQYIIGEWDFRDITLKMVPPVFIPRPETEILVDFILKHVTSLGTDGCNILDIGCGSGAICLALVHANSKIKCTAIDKSLYACNLTRDNAKLLGIEDNVNVVNAVLRNNGTIRSIGNEIVNFEDRFDIIVSNPPYIPTDKILDLAPEIKLYEDLRALDGGKDGLTIVKALLKYASENLNPHGVLFMEVDHKHPEYIDFFTKKYSDLKLQHIHTHKDYCNNDRFVEIVKLR